MNNIILIGMPGAGKSTLGVVLAKVLGYDFLDSDLLIQKKEKKRLPDIIAEYGIDYFICIENEVNQSIVTRNTVIATGGSVIYGKEAMQHLQTLGRVIYLKLSLNDLKKRLGNLEGRGVIMKDGHTLEDLFEERRPLYEKYADLTADLSGRNLEESLQLVLNAL